MSAVIAFPVQTRAPDLWLVPERLPVAMRMHLSMARGGRMSIWRNDEHGIERCDHLAKRGEPWQVTYRADALPDREFASFRELRCALAEARQAQ